LSKFTGDISCRFMDDVDGRHAQLLEPLVWECDFKGSGLTVTVPAGFITDGASVPRLLWWLMPAWGDKGTRAAMVHDYLLDMMHLGQPVAGMDVREAIDWQFYLMLKALDVPEWRARVCYWGVAAYSHWVRISKLVFGADMP